MSNLLSQILNVLFTFTNDWGIAIVGLTLVVKLLLLPLSLKQKISLKEQSSMGKEVDEIKEKYKNNKTKMDEELNLYYLKNSKNLLGCFISLFQLPVIFSLFKVVRTLNIDVGSKLIPWAESLKMHDSSYILPIIYIVVSIVPHLLSYISYFKGFNENKSIKQNIVTIILISIFVIVKSPVALGIYFVTSGLVSFIEEVIYMMIVRKNIMIEKSR